jgi:hypothetical protein
MITNTFLEDATYSPFTTVTESDAMLTPPEAIQHVKCRKKRKKDPDMTTVSNVTMTMNVTDNYGNLTDNDSSDICKYIYMKSFKIPNG